MGQNCIESVNEIESIKKKVIFKIDAEVQNYREECDFTKYFPLIDQKLEEFKQYEYPLDKYELIKIFDDEFAGNKLLHEYW